MIKRTLCMLALGLALTACAEPPEDDPMMMTNNDPMEAMNPFDKSDAAVVMQGLEAYGSNGCGGCHGDMGAGPNFVANATDLTTSGARSDAYLFDAIRKGISGTAMNAYAGIDDDTTWQIVTWIRSIEQ